MRYHQSVMLAAGAVGVACLLATARGESKSALPGIAVFAGPTATILNTDPPVTSRKAREKYGLPALRDWFGRPVATDTLYYQRLAAPVTVYIEQFSAHPLERDAAALFAPPDGYLDSQNVFNKERRSPADRPVYEVVLRPEDGLYPLPYMARQADGSAWTGYAGVQGGIRQTFYPDAARVFEELERTGSVLNGNISARAQLAFFRVAPPGGYTAGLPAAERTDAGFGDIPPEKAGTDFFPYGYVNTNPPRIALAKITNDIQRTLASGAFRGALWLEGSPRVEDTLYWLNLVIDTDCMIVGTAAQRPNHRLSADAPQNLVDAVDFVLSDVWRDGAGGNRTGAVLVQDQQIFAAREVVKAAARPGGFATVGGHGGIIGSTTGPTLMFFPNRRYGKNSEVRYSLLPASVVGIHRGADGRLGSVPVAVKDGEGHLLGEAIPQVEIIVLNDWMTAPVDGKSSLPPSSINALITRSLAEAPLTGIVAEGVQGGHFDAAEVAALERATLQGIPVVKVFRGTTAGLVFPWPGNLQIEGSNLNATKARVLLMACLLRFGSPPPVADPGHPTEAELSAIRAHLARFQTVFDTH
jgi:L-asparaginase